jgi:hypothetical protein
LRTGQTNTVASAMTRGRTAPLHLREIARAILGDANGVRVLDDIELPSGSITARVRGRWRVYVESMPPTQQAAAVLRELADILADCVCLSQIDRETVGDIVTEFALDLWTATDNPPASVSYLRLVECSCAVA